MCVCVSFIDLNINATLTTQVRLVSALRRILPPHMSGHDTQGSFNRNTRLTQTVDDSAIDLHLSDNPDFAEKYTESKFTILGHAPSAKYLRILEVIRIKLD